MQKHKPCFKDFPDQCEGCPDYVEKHPDSALPLVLLTGTGIMYPEREKNVVIKECKRYHRRKVEPLK